MINESVFADSIALKILVALSNEDLKPIPLLYKLCIMDFENKLSNDSVRNINAFNFYLKSYRKILSILSDSFLIRVNNDKISLTFDGKITLENLRDFEFVSSFLQTSIDVKNDKRHEDYQSYYLSCVDNYTKHFVKKEHV